MLVYLEKWSRFGKNDTLQHMVCYGKLIQGPIYNDRMGPRPTVRFGREKINGGMKFGEGRLKSTR